ncbi:dermonecrotic toxin domain-containing protein, partial [Pantoea endophytica]
PVVTPSSKISVSNTAIATVNPRTSHFRTLKSIGNSPGSTESLFSAVTDHDIPSHSTFSVTSNVRQNVKYALQEISEFYTFRTAAKNIFSPRYAEQNDAKLHKNTGIVIAESIRNLTGWAERPCYELAAIIQDAFKDIPPDFGLLKKTIKQTQLNNLHLTPDKLVSGPLKKNIFDNARAAAHLAQHGKFHFTVKITPAVALFEWLLTTFSPILCRGEMEMKEVRALKHEIKALNDEATALRSRSEGMTRMQQRADKLEAKCLEFWQALLRNPEDRILQEQFHTALQASEEFGQRRKSTRNELQRERAPYPVTNSGQSSVALLPPVVASTTTGIVATGVRRRGLFAALAGGTLIAGGGAFAMLKKIYTVPDTARMPATDSLNGKSESVFENRVSASEITELQNELEQEMAAVEPDAEGRLSILSLGDQLRELHERHGDSKNFINEARAMLLDHGLLHALDQLLLPAQNESSSLSVRRRRDVSSGAQSAEMKIPPHVDIHETAQLAVLNRLITTSGEATKNNEQLYFSKWRDRLPSGENFAWLRYAPEDRQHAYKKLLDYVATSKDAMASASHKVLVEHPGFAHIVQQLRQLHLPIQPEYIRLNATLTERVGSLSIPGSFSLTLDEAWQTGMLDKMLKAPDLEVDIQSQRRRMKGKRRDAFRHAFNGITAPPDITAVVNNDHVQLAFRQLIEARFELSTLEAELKGELRSNDQIRGLQIVSKFRAGANDVKAGQLTFSARDNSGQPMQIPLSGWLVLRDDEGSCVLYDADASERRHYFSSERKCCSS